MPTRKKADSKARMSRIESQQIAADWFARVESDLAKADVSPWRDMWRAEAVRSQAKAREYYQHARNLRRAAYTTGLEPQQ